MVNLSNVALTPSLVAINDLAGGSTGQTLFEVQGAGFGPDATGLNLIHNGAELCAEVTPTDYGTFTCLTVAGVEVLSSDLIELSVEGVNYGCSNADTTQC